MGAWKGRLAPTTSGICSGSLSLRLSEVRTRAAGVGVFGFLAARTRSRWPRTQTNWTRKPYEEFGTASGFARAGTA
ncbi:hypothetical protein GCM10022255_060020 [Dactylosporangium darangshiense]|uniref:Uncharacterized protein n=1 Tax=Dactylosporangium darangshiense TaxID=579108 RepID=A0ABP8DF97_9ACTN